MHVYTRPLGVNSSRLSDVRVGPDSGFIYKSNIGTEFQWN